MNGRMLAQDAGIVGVVTTLIIGGSLAGFGLGGVIRERDRLRAQAAQPRPAPTVTVTATPAEQTPALSPRPSHTARDRAVVAAEPAARSAAEGSQGRTVGPQRTGGLRSSTAPRPRPAPSTSSPPADQPQPDRCEGAVSVRLPLGVLPQCTLTIGGSR